MDSRRESCLTTKKLDNKKDNKNVANFKHSTKQQQKKEYEIFCFIIFKIYIKILGFEFFLDIKNKKLFPIFL